MAQREVRAAAEAVWLVHMGRAAHDGPFAQFVEKVLAQPLTLGIDHLHYRSLRGQAITFSMSEPFDTALLVDDRPQPLDGFPHLESLYGGTRALPAAEVEIRYQEHVMRLDLGIRAMPNAM
jgi:hypothetical protein